MFLSRMLQVIREDSKRTFRELFLYSFITVIVYMYVFIALHILIEMLKINPSASFFLIYATVYPLSYFSQLFVFRKGVSSDNVIRFILHKLLFFGLSNVMYNILFYSGLHYYVCTGITIVIIFPVRFISSKKLVFGG